MRGMNPERRGDYGRAVMCLASIESGHLDQVQFSSFKAKCPVFPSTWQLWIEFDLDFLPPCFSPHPSVLHST
jgi:hypothetical protein